ncbi:MAG TPA: cation-efflux pump [Saprospirales bacterium]|nr:cation-efflux pump [Saprospirales bacterium]HAY71595.1 cation-efflux pump [Saprospirales bacterium]HRQ29987.1 cation diffusion facilitator family transporter [Saprospiraceae bacterium]
MSKDRVNIAVGTSIYSIFGNLALAIIKATAGILGNSFALIADAIESVSDIFASILVFFGLKYASRSADKNHPYGHGKAEPLVTFLVVGFLLFSAILIAVQSIKNIQSPQTAPKPYTLIILGIIILIKEGFYRFVNKRSELTESSSLKADAWHHRSDAITSLTAFIGISLSILLGPGFESAEDFAALAASGFILYNAYLIFRPALGEVMDEHSYDELALQIREQSKKTSGIIDTEKCFIRKSGMNYLVDLHAIVAGKITVREGHKIAHELKESLMKAFPHIADVLIHVEPDTYEENPEKEDQPC